MKAYQDGLAKLEENDSVIFGVSVDSVPANAEFAKQLGITFPLLSDFTRKVSKDYGILDDERHHLLIRHLAKSEIWQRTYSDSVGTVFVRRQPI